MKRTTLSPADASWLEETFARNRAAFGGFFMGPEDDADDQDDTGGADDDQDDSDADDGDDADWKAKFEAQQRINKSLERKTKKDAATIASLTGKKPAGGGKGDDDKGDAPDPDKIRAEARAEAEREALHGRIEDKIEAKARAFADPEDAVAVLLRSHDINDFLDENNKIDVEAITDALKDLGEKKPHLLAQGGRFQGGADGGARKDTKTRAKSLGDAISRHYDKS